MPILRSIPASSATLSVDLTLPASAALQNDTYYLVIQLDTIKDQIETDETNNVYSLPIYLQQPPVPESGSQ